MQRIGVRRSVLRIVSAAAAALMLITYSAAQTKMEGEVSERGAPLLNDFGNHEFSISTKSPTARERIAADPQIKSPAQCDVWRLADITLTASRF
jgi:hypothetical protein